MPVSRSISETHTVMIIAWPDTVDDTSPAVYLVIVDYESDNCIRAKQYKVLLRKEAEWCGGGAFPLTKEVCFTCPVEATVISSKEVHMTVKEIMETF